MSHSVHYDNESRVDNSPGDFDTYQVKRTEVIKHGGSHDGHLIHSPGGHSKYNYNHSERNLASNHHRLGENAVPALVQAFSGAVGSSIANVAVHPLDIVVKRLQVQRHIQNQIRAQHHSRSGVKSSSPRRHASSSRERLHQTTSAPRRSRGNSPEKMILGVDDRDSAYAARSGERGGRSEHLKSQSKGYTSTGSYVETTETVEYIETSEDYEYTEQYHGVIDCAQKIWAEEGLGGFYTGVVEETIGTLGSAFWYFAAYSYMRNKRLHKRHTQKLPVLEELLIGLVAGSFSRIFLTPFNNIATRKQTHAMLYPNAKAPGIVQIYHDIMREKGITGFWSGYSANIFLSLNPSITFMLYESLKNFAGGNRRRMKGAETFLIAAVAKAIATGLTYPLSVAKSRTQVANEEDGFDIRDITSIGKAGEEIKKRISRKKKKAGNLIEVLADIFKREGIAGLYEGVIGELLRGFVSSGITMVIKESVHRTILSLYYFVMRAYNRTEDHTFHSTTKLMAKDAYDKAGPRQKKLLNKAIESKHKVSGLIEASKEKVVGGHHSEETRRHDGMKMKAAAATAVAGLAAGAIHSHRKNDRHDEHGNVIVHTARERVEEWREGVDEDSHRVGHAGHIDDRIHTGETHQNLHQSHSHSGHSGSRVDQFGRTGVTEHTRIDERIEHGHSGGSHGRHGSTVAAGVVGATTSAIGHKLSGHSRNEHSQSHIGNTHSTHGGDIVTKTTKVVEEFGIVKDPRSTHLKNIHDGHQAVTDSRSRFGETSHTSIHEERGRQHGIVGSVAEKIVGHGHSSHSRGRSQSDNRHGSSALELTHKATGNHRHGHGHRDGQTIIHSTETVEEWRDEANAVEDLRQFGVASTVHEDSRSDFGESLHKGHSIVGHGHSKRFGDDSVHHDHGRTVVEKTQITRINENLHNGGHHKHGHNTHQHGGVIGKVVGAAEKIVGHGHTHNDSRSNFGHTDGRTIVEKTEIKRINENVHDGGHHSHGHNTHNTHNTHNLSGSSSNFGGSTLNTDGRTIVEKTEITRINENIHDGGRHSHGHNTQRQGGVISAVVGAAEKVIGHGHNTHGHKDSRTNFDSSALHTDGRKIVEKTEVTRINENIHDGGRHSHSHGTQRQGGVIGAVVGAAEKIVGHGQSTHRHNESRSNFGDALHADGRIIEKTQITRINENLHDGAHHNRSTLGSTHSDSRSNFGGTALHTDGRTIVERTETIRETHHGSPNAVPTHSPLSRIGDVAINKVVGGSQTARFSETHHDAGRLNHRSSSSNHGHSSGLIPTAIAAGKVALGLDNTHTSTFRETSSGSGSGSGWLGKKALGNSSINTAAATAGSNGVTTITRTEEFWPVDEDARSSVYNFLDEETKEAGGVRIETRTAEQKWWDDKRGKGYN